MTLPPGGALTEGDGFISCACGASLVPPAAPPAAPCALLAEGSRFSPPILKPPGLAAEAAGLEGAAALGAAAFGAGADFFAWAEAVCVENRPVEDRTRRTAVAESIFTGGKHMFSLYVTSGLLYLLPICWGLLWVFLRRWN